MIEKNPQPYYLIMNKLFTPLSFPSQTNPLYIFRKADEVGVVD